MIVPCAVVGMFALGLAGQALANDISGVRIGSTLSEASIAIKRANKAFVIKPFKLESGQLAGLSALSGHGDPASKEGAADEFVVLQNAAGKVWFVARYQRLVPGARVSQSALLAWLTQKFGEPIVNEMPGRSVRQFYSWDTDRAGKRVTAAQDDNPCNGLGFAGPPVAGGNILAPRRIPRNCGTRIMLSDLFVQDGLVNEFTLKVIDVKAASDDLQRDKQQRASELERERKSGVKPQI